MARLTTATPHLVTRLSTAATNRDVLATGGLLLLSSFLLFFFSFSSPLVGLCVSNRPDRGMCYWQNQRPRSGLAYFLAGPFPFCYAVRARVPPGRKECCCVAMGMGKMIFVYALTVALPKCHPLVPVPCYTVGSGPVKRERTRSTNLLERVAHAVWSPLPWGVGLTDANP